MTATRSPAVIASTWSWVTQMGVVPSWCWMPAISAHSTWPCAVLSRHYGEPVRCVSAGTADYVRRRVPRQVPCCCATSWCYDRPSKQAAAPCDGCPIAESGHRHLDDLGV